MSELTAPATRERREFLVERLDKPACCLRMKDSCTKGSANPNAESEMVLDGSERELIEACRRGEREGFRALFELHKDKVYSIARHYANEESAMDLTQDIFVKLFSSIHGFRGEGPFKSWLYRTVVNRCIDQKRERPRLLPFPDWLLDGGCSSAETALQKLLRQELSDEVRSAVGKLPGQQRIVIVLRYTKDLSYEEIAEVLGCARGTVASRLNRAHKILERRLEHLARREGRC